MLLIKDGRVIDPKSGKDEILDIVIEGEKIKYIGKFQITPEYEKVINAKGKIVAPGFIDVHVHFREPGFTYKEDIMTGSNAAAKGGYTTVVCMANTKPPVDNLETLNEILQKAKNSKINVLTVANVTMGMKGESLTDMEALAKNGASGFSDDGIYIQNTKLLLEAMNKARELNLPISLHEEDRSLIEVQGINDGMIAKEMGFRGAPDVSESLAVARDLMLALKSKAKVNFQHISSLYSVKCLKMAKELSDNITAEVTPQHICLTENDILKYGTNAKINPPFRTEEDKYALIEGLKNGTIDIIATDHAPHSKEEKSKDFKDAPSGIIGLESSLSILLEELVFKGHLTISDLIEKMTVNPAKLYNLDLGYIAEGSIADIVIFDDKEKWIFNKSESKSFNSPFAGKELTGKIKYTISKGKIAYSEE